MYDNDWPPFHHPWNIAQLKLWFGGREYSPYPHVLTTPGYVWEERRSSAEETPALPELSPEALKALEEWRKSGAPASRTMQY
jgi:hypothetical protein